MTQQLEKLSEHVWLFPFDSPKDRPNLGYIRGQNIAMAIDAGHSSSHVDDFYSSLEKEGLPLPDLTVITHWHWDHTFGMHAVHGKTLVRPETNSKLRRIQSNMDSDSAWKTRFLTSDPSIRKEYAGGVPLIVVPGDEEVDRDRVIDLGGVTAEILYAESPHTGDALLIYVPEDKALFIGDAQLGEFPSWRMDFGKLSLLADKIRGIDAEIIIDGHWRPYSKKEFLAEIS